MMENMNQSSSTNEIQELHAMVRGQVQGVGFRYFVVQKPQSLGLRGYARNESNGDVEVLAQGPRPALERLLTLLWRGAGAGHGKEGEIDWMQPHEHISGGDGRL